MGRFVNPNNSAFQVALNSPIYVDKTGMIAYTIAFLVRWKDISATAVRGGSGNHMQRICSQLITAAAAARKQCLLDWKPASLPTSRNI